MKRRDGELRMRKTAQKVARSADEADPQKDALYRWEEAWRDWNLSRLTLKECRKLIHGACKRFRLNSPRVRQHTVRSISFCIPRIGVISLQGVGIKKFGGTTGGKNEATALHEAAHYIVWHRFGERPQDHGPTFFGVYMNLLECAKIAPIAALHASARAAGLRWRRDVGEKCRKN